VFGSSEERIVASMQAPGHVCGVREGGVDIAQQSAEVPHV